MGKICSSSKKNILQGMILTERNAHIEHPELSVFRVNPDRKNKFRVLNTVDSHKNLKVYTKTAKRSKFKEPVESEQSVISLDEYGQPVIVFDEEVTEFVKQQYEHRLTLKKSRSPLPLIKSSLDGLSMTKRFTIPDEINNLTRNNFLDKVKELEMAEICSSQKSENSSQKQKEVEVKVKRIQKLSKIDILSQQKFLKTSRSTQAKQIMSPIRLKRNRFSIERRMFSPQNVKSKPLQEISWKQPIQRTKIINHH